MKHRAASLCQKSYLFKEFRRQLLCFADMNSSRNVTASELPRSFNVSYDVSLYDDDFILSDDLSESARTAFYILYIVIIILGLGGNCMTLLVVAVNRNMRTVTNVFLVSLAVSDALIAGVNMPLQLHVYAHHEWTLGEGACKLGGYTQGVVVVASILTLISLAVDR